MNFANIKLRYIHKKGCDILDAYLPNEPDDPFNRTVGWHPKKHPNPTMSAVICMNIWMGLNQNTLYDTYDQCSAGVSISRVKRLGGGDL